MAKIGSLQVDTLNIAHNAVTGSNMANGSGNGTTQVTVSNPAAMPVQLFYYVDCNYLVNSSSAWVEFTFTATRVRGSKVLFDYQVSRDGAGMVELRNTVLDISAAANDVYRLEVFVMPRGQGSSGSCQKRQITAEFVKK